MSGYRVGLRYGGGERPAYLYLGEDGRFHPKGDEDEFVTPEFEDAEHEARQALGRESVDALYVLDSDDRQIGLPIEA